MGKNRQGRELFNHKEQLKCRHWRAYTKKNTGAPCAPRAPFVQAHNVRPLRPLWFKPVSSVIFSNSVGNVFPEDPVRSEWIETDWIAGRHWPFAG
jgi:hypothetical protein